MPNCLKCGDALAVNEEGVAPVLCDRCAGVATSRARRTLSTGTFRDYPATMALLGINLAVFFSMLLSGVNVADPSGRDLIRWGGNYGPMTISGQYWRLVTTGFLHAGLLHIGLNMWCLISLGRICERLFGKWQTFLIYLLTGVGGALLSIANNPERLEVGASGAVFGIAGAILAGLKFGNLSISVGERRSIISGVLFFVIFSVYMGLNSPDTDNICHLGGFVSGLLVGLPLGAFIAKGRLVQIGIFAVTTVVIVAGGKELVDTHGPTSQKGMAMLARSQGDYRKEAQLLESYTSVHPEDDDALIDLGAAYMLTRQPEKAISAFSRALKANPNSEEAREALEELKAPTDPNKK